MMKYNLDDRPGIGPLLLYGLQWWVVSVPSIVIMGMVVARLHGDDAAMQIWYMQKLFVLTGAGSVVQVLCGHRLPLVAGPASTLLIGIAATSGAGIEATYTAICAGGAVLALFGWSGVLSRLRFFFTPRIVAVVLVLIAITLTPTILDLIVDDASPTASLMFAVAAVFGLIACNKLLRGVWKSLTVIIGVVGGTALYALTLGLPLPATEVAAPDAVPSLLIDIDIHPGAMLSFLFCFLALTINELGSIESIGQMLGADDMPRRIRRGTAMQGGINIVAGACGVIGTVDYSMSAGLIAATRCASRFTLVPAGLGIMLCGFFPQVMTVLGHLPGPVMGALMLYLMSAQLAGGLDMLVKDNSVHDFNSGIIVGFPLMLGLLIAFAPPAALAEMPALLKPVCGNGFVMGALAVIILEHGLLKSACPASPIPTGEAPAGTKQSERDSA